MTNFHQTPVQSGDCKPAKGGKKDQDTAILQGLAAKLQGKVSTLEAKAQSGGSSGGSGGGSNGSQRNCFKCGSPDHIKKDCPQKNGGSSNGGSSSRPQLPEWRKKAPGSEEAKTKTVDGVVHKWCEKCRFGKGMWTAGDRAHSTEEHRSSRNQQESTQQSESGRLAVLPSTPLEVHFG